MPAAAWEHLQDPGQADRPADWLANIRFPQKETRADAVNNPATIEQRHRIGSSRRGHVVASLLDLIGFPSKPKNENSHQPLGYVKVVNSVAGLQ